MDGDKENHQIAQCPQCQCEVSVRVDEFKGRLRLYCRSCGNLMLDWEQGKQPSAPIKTNSESKPSEHVDLSASRHSRVPFEVAEPKVPATILGGEKPKLPPEQVGDYQLLRLIGQGTVGEIYLGRHLRKGTEVAIKLLSQRMQQEQTAVERFLQEAKVHSRLDHPNIVRIEDVGYCPNSKRLYLVMEYVEGDSLEKILVSRGAIPPRHAVKIAIAVAHALEHALKQRIIHRDLKPGNILIDKRSRRVKVTDLGLGKILEEKGATIDGELMGTAYYMPPEQIRNAKVVDHRADIYALGATIYHMLAGRPPYGEFKGTLNILKNKISQDPIPLQEYVPGLPDVLSAIVTKAMAREKEARYENPTQMIEEMQKALDNAKF